MYHRLRVPPFGRLLRNTPLRYLNPAVYLSRKHPDPPKVYRQIEAAEAAHFWAALLFTPYIGYVWLRGNHLREAVVLLLFQIFFNVYPILHLRIVRGRLDRVVQRQHARQ
jgi:Glycosyl-4,4'-diaponeurosporenoate acyltransferase